MTSTAHASATADSASNSTYGTSPLEAFSSGSAGSPKSSPVHQPYDSHQWLDDAATTSPQPTRTTNARPDRFPSLHLTSSPRRLPTYSRTSLRVHYSRSLFSAAEISEIAATMGLLGISLLVASFVYVILRPPPCIPPQYIIWRGLLPLSLRPPRPLPSSSSSRGAASRGAIADDDDAAAAAAAAAAGKGEAAAAHAGGKPVEPRDPPSAQARAEPEPRRPLPPPSDEHKGQAERARQLMLPPPPPLVVQPPTLAEPDSEEHATPKAEPAKPSPAVPSFSLTDHDDDDSAPPPRPAPAPGASPSVMMPPPPPPLSGRLPPAGRLPSLAQFPAANSAQRARGPAPNRGSAPSLGGGLAPPPTHSSKPAKPSRKVLLTPGHSPLDWARISGPNSDLRGLPSSTPYLRVTPSMLKKQTGRKGKDAWMALNGKVYNVTPYAEYHPGGVPELIRGAGRDGTKLFGEIHPWVNYETMLSACMVGLLVEEAEATSSTMDQMD